MNYKEAYSLCKKAGFWDDTGNKIKQAWDSYNDFADKNQWVRPAIYGLGGAGAGAGAGLLMKNPVASVLLGLLGGTLGAAGGAIHNDQRGINLNNLNKEHKDKWQEAAKKNGMSVAELYAGQAKKNRALANTVPQQHMNPHQGDLVNYLSAALIGGGAATLGGTAYYKWSDKLLDPKARQALMKKTKSGGAGLLMLLNILLSPMGKIVNKRAPQAIVSPGPGSYTLPNVHINIPPGWRRTMMLSGGRVVPPHLEQVR